MRALAPLACLGVALALAGPAALGDRDIYVGDVSHFELPRDELVSARFRAGEGLPRWIPGIYGGAPALGAQELALFYPVNDLFLLIAPGRARIWGLVFHLVLAALGARALARRLGAGEAAALVAGLAYGFGGAAVSMNVVLVYARTAGWLPWAVLGVVRASAGERRGLALATGAFLGTYLGGDPLGCAFAALAGAATTLVVPGPEPLAVRARSVLGTLVLAAGLAALLGAVQLVPALGVVGESSRQEGVTYEGATARSLWPPELVGLVVPFAFGSQGDPRTTFYEALTREPQPAWSEVLYVGPIALALAGLALFWSFRKSARKTGKPSEYDGAVHAGLALVVLFLPLALGKFAPAYRLFYLLPGASLFRFPAKLFLHASLGIALLAAAGAQALLQGEPEAERGERRKLALRTLAVLGGVLLAASLAATAGREALGERIDALGAPELRGKVAVDALADRISHAAYFAFGGAVLLAKKRGSARRSSSRKLGVALALLVALDLALACRPALILGPRDEILRPPAAAAVLGELARADGAPARVYPTFDGRHETARDLEEAREAGDAGILRGSFEGLLPDAGLAHGVYSQLGFLSNAPLRISVVRDAAEALRRGRRISPARDAALRGARFALCRQDEVSGFEAGGFTGPGEGVVVARLPGGRALVRLTQAPPWAGVYRRARFASGIQEGIDALGAKDPLREVAIEGPPAAGLEGSGEDALVHEARVTLVNGRLEPERGSLDPERVELAVETPVRGWLVVRETFARGWSASIGGRQATIRPADVAFRAVEVPAGHSSVVFEYSAPGATAGALLSLLGVVGCLAVWGRGRVRRKQ